MLVHSTKSRKRDALKNRLSENPPVISTGARSFQDKLQEKSYFQRTAQRFLTFVRNDKRLRFVKSSLTKPTFRTISNKHWAIFLSSSFLLLASSFSYLTLSQSRHHNILGGP